MLVPVGVRAQAGAADTLRVALTQEPATLDPLRRTRPADSGSRAANFDAQERRYQRRRPHDHVSARPQRALDGVPVTSADVKFNFDALTSAKNNVVQRDPYDRMVRVETPDPYIVRIVLRRPWAPALQGFHNGIDGSIVPAHLLANAADLNSKLVAWHHASDMTFAADPRLSGVSRRSRISSFAFSTMTIR